MKRITTSILVLIAFSSLLFTEGCKKNDPTPAVVLETTRVKGLLKSAAWKIQSVTVDGTDKSTLFTGLTLSFTETSYATTNGGVVWPASGTWTFTDDAATKIKRNDGLEITLLEVTDATIKLSLIWAQGTIGPGRVSSISGTHVFTFVK